MPAKHRYVHFESGAKKKVTQKAEKEKLKAALKYKVLPYPKRPN